ncbi:MAG: undecaprenyl-phosphate glucose phosphotransferase [Gammaproteobacteria bacterium]
MTEPITLRRGLWIALIATMQAMAPPVTAVATLYALCRLYGVEFTDFFLVLSVLASLLTVLLPTAQNNGTKPQILNGTVPLAARVVTRWLIIVGILLGIGYATKYIEDFSRRVVLSWIVATPMLLILAELVLQEIMRRLLYDPANMRRVVFAGCNEVSLALAERISASTDLGLKVRGFFDDRCAERLGSPASARLLGPLPDLVSYVKRHHIDVIFVALPIRHVRRVVDLMDQLHDTTASIYYVPDIFVFDLIQARTGELLGIPVVAMCETPFYGYRGVVKRMTDIALASSVLLVAAPLMILIAFMVRYTSPGPALFRQRRYGLDGREIMVYKFRTMTVLEDGAHVTQATREDQRVTRVGRFLRRYSLDELPQLINVLEGHMSLVGPRPHAVAHNEEYRKLIKGYMLRHKVPPGITGLAQINGCRGETSHVKDMQARVDYDLEYLRQWSPLLDLKILALTAVRLVGDRKAY